MILDKRHLSQIAIMILEALLFSQAFSRHDSIHELPTSIIAFLAIFLSAEVVFNIQAHAQVGEPIFVGNQRHDLISINDIGFYFLSAHPSATFYHELYPGVVTTRDVQKAIAGEITSQGVNWIVLVDTGRSYDPNASSISSGVHYLDDNIRSRYVRVAEFGIYEIWTMMAK